MINAISWFHYQSHSGIYGPVTRRQICKRFTQKTVNNILQKNPFASFRKLLHGKLVHPACAIRLRIQCLAQALLKSMRIWRQVKLAKYVWLQTRDPLVPTDQSYQRPDCYCTCLVCRGQPAKCTALGLKKGFLSFPYHPMNWEHDD